MAAAKVPTEYACKEIVTRAYRMSARVPHDSLVLATYDSLVVARGWRLGRREAHMTHAAIYEVTATAR